MERTDDYPMARMVLMADVSGGRVRGRPRLGWMDGVRWLGQQMDDGGGYVTMH